MLRVFLLLLVLSECWSYECHYVRIYQLYFEDADLEELYSDPCYRGLQLSAQGATRAGDLNAAKLWPKLEDSHFQKRTCEFGAMVALRENLAIHPWSWIGFTSWREKRKGFNSRINFPSLEQRLSHAEEAIYFWNDGEGVQQEEQGRLYQQMENAHPGAVSVLNTLFILLWNSTLPPLPENPEPWIYSSMWIMSTKLYQRWMSYVTPFIDEFDRLFSHRPCPFGYTNLAKGRASTAEEYINRVCYCFILERLVNIWAYHSNVTMIFLPSAGDYREVHRRPREGQGLLQPPFRKKDTRGADPRVPWISLLFLSFVVCSTAVLFRRCCGGNRIRQYVKNAV